MKLNESQIRKLIREVISDELTRETESKRKGRAKQIQTEYVDTKFRKGNKRIRTLNFKSKHPQGSGKFHKQRIEIPDYRQISKQKKGITLQEKIQLATEAGDINVHCSCPDWKWKGYEWMADAGNYGIKQQDIPPNERNPQLEGSLCKHLQAILENLEKFYPEIVKDFKDYRELRRQGKG